MQKKISINSDLAQKISFSLQPSAMLGLEQPAYAWLNKYEFQIL